MTHKNNVLRLRDEYRRLRKETLAILGGSNSDFDLAVREAMKAEKASKRPENFIRFARILFNDAVAAEVAREDEYDGGWVDYDTGYDTLQEYRMDRAWAW